MEKKCVVCRNRFEVGERDLEFYSRLDVPVPLCCSRCRRERRLAWRNENNYYSRECGLCRKSVISVYSEDGGYEVYCNKCWWSDRWDALSYGRNYDFSRSFFDQYMELHRAVPQLAMMNDEGIASENCEYCYDFAFGRNCYLVTGSWRLEDSLYSNNCNHGKEIVDCNSVNIESELVYESCYSQKLNKCSFLSHSSNCHDCHFGFDLKGCRNCVGCFGLRQKEFCIFNKEYSEEEYWEKVGELKLSSYSGQQRFKSFYFEKLKSYDYRGPHQVNCEDCVGEHLFNCRQVEGRDLFNSEFCRFCEKGDAQRNCYDIYQSGNPQWCLDCVTPDDSYMVAFSLWCWKSRFVMYSDNCHSSENLFGCVGLKRRKNCVLNKEYSESDYLELRQKIVEGMKHEERELWQFGEFFPVELSPFEISETVVGEMSSLGGGEVNEVLIDDIAEVSDEIVAKVLGCGCGKSYKITPLELRFYRKMGVPVPRKCVRCRRGERLTLRSF